MHALILLVSFSDKKIYKAVSIYYVYIYIFEKQKQTDMQ